METFIKPTYSPFQKDGFYELERVQIGMDADVYRLLMRALEDACESSSNYLDIERWVKLRLKLHVDSFLLDK